MERAINHNGHGEHNEDIIKGRLLGYLAKIDAWCRDDESRSWSRMKTQRPKLFVEPAVPRDLPRGMSLWFVLRFFA